MASVNTDFMTDDNNISCLAPHCPLSKVVEESEKYTLLQTDFPRVNSYLEVEMPKGCNTMERKNREEGKRLQNTP